MRIFNNHPKEIKIFIGVTEPAVSKIQIKSSSFSRKYKMEIAEGEKWLITAKGDRKKIKIRVTQALKYLNNYPKKIKIFISVTEPAVSKIQRKYLSFSRKYKMEIAEGEKWLITAKGDRKKIKIRVGNNIKFILFRLYFDVHLLIFLGNFGKYNLLISTP